MGLARLVVHERRKRPQASSRKSQSRHIFHSRQLDGRLELLADAPARRVIEMWLNQFGGKGISWLEDKVTGAAVLRRGEHRLRFAGPSTTAGSPHGALTGSGCHRISTARSRWAATSGGSEL